MSELMPCPFCGDIPKVREIGNDFTKTRKAKTLCCPTMSMTVGAIRYPMSWAVDRLTKRWNTRPIEDALRARVEALEESLRSGVWTDCKECGLLVEVDEDGCCVTCGRDSIVYSDKARVEALEAENERLRRAVEAVQWFIDEVDGKRMPEHMISRVLVVEGALIDCGFREPDGSDRSEMKVKEYRRALRVAEGEDE